jgi:hypothetical protein|tara:strand:- start:654 stop:812 length:159 start_codon:yes stop_codon:yes gene_type:complete
MLISPELISLNSNTPQVSASGIVFEYAGFARRFDGNRNDALIFQLIPPATIN